MGLEKLLNVRSPSVGRTLAGSPGLPSALKQHEATPPKAAGVDALSYSRRSLFFSKLTYLFIYLWLCWVFVSVRGLSLVAASGGHSSSRCAGLLLSRPLLLRSTSSRRTGSVVVAHGPSCSAACGIFPDQGSSLCPRRWQGDSLPLRHQGSPPSVSFNFLLTGLPSTQIMARLFLKGRFRLIDQI